MLAIGIELNRHLIAMAQCVLHARLDASGKAQVGWMAHIVEAASLT